MPTKMLLLPRLPIKSLRENGRQYYLKSNGMRYPNVSTILNATKPQAERDRLKNWRQRLGTEAAQQVSTTASRRGTQTHKHIRNYLQGKELAISQTSLPYWESIQPVLANIDNIRLIESPIVHENLGYGGVVDCVASYHGVPCVCEWKTADKPKGSLERLFDFPLQLAAYLGAVNASYYHYDIELSHALIVVAIPDLPAEIFWFDRSKIEPYWQQWQTRVKAYWQKQTTY
jgi:hypothetical protein